MDMDNARWAMDVLRAATEQNEGNTPSNTAINPYKLPVPSNYVSQFRIDGQPILPPLMTAEKRRQMQQLRQQALELETRLAIRSTSTVDESQSLDAKQEEKSDSSSSSNSSSSGGNSSSNSSSGSNSSSTINTTQRLPQLQKTETFIYDSTQQQDQMIDYHQEEEQLSLQRNRPQTLDIEPTPNALIPTICVNPPTPLQPIDTTYAPSPTVSTALGTPQRKLNNITNRILKFESTGSEQPTEALQPTMKPTNMLWQNETLIVGGDKRMMRSSTSPALSAAQMNDKQFNRSRSFTLEQPSQALVEHMEREAKKPSSPSPPSPPPPVPPLPAEVSPRCRFAVHGVSSSPSALGLAHLRRDTVESRAKQVQRNIQKSPSSTTTSVMGVRRRGGSSTAARLQYQQRQLEELLQRALHDTNDVLAGQEQLERNKLSLAKRQMFKDIKLAHRDRFQQLVQYQHEEQRRMQEEFDRQQKFLIDQICTEINVSAYAHEPLNNSAASPSGISEYTSTDDLPTPTSPSNTFTLDSLDMTPRSLDLTTGQENSSMHTARKRLFDVDNDTDSQMSALKSSPTTTRPQQSASTSSRSSSMRNSNKIKRPVQRSQSKSTPPTSKKIISPVQSMAKSKSPTPARRVTSNNKTTSNSTSPQQTLQTLSKTRRSASPSRLTPSEMQRRHEAATLLNAATRGFLVRRLFRTEQVQRIVQTIRDTLIFVLNLHMETYGSSLEHEEPSNIRLKARLLQQLCSASRTLHLIFFQTSIKERMEIIARDRKRIKTKLMAMHVKNRQ